MEKHEKYLFSHSCLQQISLFIFSYFYSTRSPFLLIANFVSGNKCWLLIRFGHFSVVQERGRRSPLRSWTATSLYHLYPGSYISNQITCYMSSLQLHHTAVVGTAWSAAKLATERPGRVIHFSKTFNPIGRTSVNACVFETRVAWWCVGSTSALISFPVHRWAQKKYQVMRPTLYTKLLLKLEHPV
jgi:hypothetical protein